MKTKFTKRSSKDGTLVTVPLAQFDNDPELSVVRGSCNVGMNFILVIDGVPTVFTTARPDKGGFPTVAVSRGFPRHLRLPRVGRPVYAEVSEVR